MRLGIIARCDNRGIAYQTEEACKGLRPDKTLVVLMNDRKWPETPERYQKYNPIYAQSDMRSRRLPEDKVRKFMEGLDAVFAVETLYDWELIMDVADELGVRVVVQGNPEFYTHHKFSERPHPHQWVWPTYWMLGHEDMPSQIGVLPVPAPVSPVSWEDQPDPHEGPLRILHVAGHKALGDRNGTDLFMDAVPMLGPNIHVTVIGQDGVLPDPARIPRGVEVELQPRGVADRWDLYRNQHVIILPRRYGGLCLPAIEAATSGVAVMMPNAEENSGWPIVPIPTRAGRLQRVPFGMVKTHHIRPHTLAAEIGKLSRDRERLDIAVRRAQDWALDNDWTSLRTAYEEVLEG